MATGAIVGALNHGLHEAASKWEQKQVERIYNLLSNNEGGLTYDQLVEGIKTSERTLYLSGEVKINGEKVHLCISIDMSKHHLGHKLFLDGRIKHMDNAKFKGSFKEVMREGRYLLYRYVTSYERIATDPFSISFPEKYYKILGF